MNDLIARCVSALEEVDIDATKTEDIVRIVIGRCREPTIEMLHAQSGWERNFSIANSQWRQMIDEALKP